MIRFSGRHYPRITKKEKELEVPTEKSTGKTIIYKNTLKSMIPIKQTLKALVKKQLKSSKEKS